MQNLKLELEKQKQTNELVNNWIAYLLVWEKVFFKMLIIQTKSENKAKEYLKIVQNFVKETRETLEKFTKDI